MKHHPTRTSALLPLTVTAAIACLTAPAHPAHAQQRDADPVARGKYLVSVAACHDCHTPFKMGPNGPEPDLDRALSGHPESFVPPPAPAPVGRWILSATDTNTAWAGPWGTSFTANLTPDEETGLGSWTLRNFVDTIRSGRHMGRGRPVLPPMPIAVYNNFTDEDLAAVFAYLQSLPPISNRVPEPLAPAVQTADASQ